MDPLLKVSRDSRCPCTCRTRHRTVSIPRATGGEQSVPIQTARSLVSRPWLAGEGTLPDLEAAETRPVPAQSGFHVEDARWGSRTRITCGMVSEQSWKGE